MTDFNRNETCCFTGHRIVRSEDIDAINNNLKKVIASLYKSGMRRFISGGAIGFDTLASRAVLNAREEFPDIRLTLALPCRDQDRLWNAAQKAEYAEILGSADEVIYVSENYSPECMLKRNRYMVDRSSVVVVYIQYPRGGTVYTVNYALDSGLRVINILDDTEADKTYGA